MPIRVDSFIYLIYLIEKFCLYRFRKPQIEWPSDLDVYRRAFYHRHPMAEALDKLRFVSAHKAIRVRVFKRFANQRELKCLRGLRVVDSPALKRALNAAGFDLFDRIGCGQRHQSRSGTCRTFNNGADLVGFDAGTDGVVDHYAASAFL